ncbi:hypothetical protein CG08_2009 [Riemerella anatipestifer]|uniref:Uncharacterized protein n=1 Tax=Riemerella anatipestifer (strain ATCC 11845 / DSM 15868 / JCM 9532 / NCTC 11014) TaxID=693978 RepID=H8M9C5_RIEAD|nr:hypothetical protein RA0C_2076 [Riemerella anatipestifer ATCC 11845 = DSM 15868]AGC41109.1 hypothetical protein G148_1805 [Riemerella anatipestifer RA-CH-2]AKP70096.1 hypothetical protein CG08_2009 [Riemerella anatipestifer]AKP72069.1 hypothetical protein CG09_1968 [Riemerella anatipestifer]SNV76602.1 Uncharacterised protein [Riemerella anatipestifer]
MLFVIVKSFSSQLNYKNKLNSIGLFGVFAIINDYLKGTKF